MATDHIEKLPPELLSQVFAYLPYHQLSTTCRLVSRRLNIVSSTCLNAGFDRVENYTNRLFNKLPKLPTRDSLRERHPMFSHHEMLDRIKTRLNYLRNVVFYRYINANLCCFFLGKVLDELFPLLRRAEDLLDDGKSIKDWQAELEEFLTLSDMGKKHMEETVVPKLKEKEAKRLRQEKLDKLMAIDTLVKKSNEKLTLAKTISEASTLFGPIRTERKAADITSTIGMNKNGGLSNGVGSGEKDAKEESAEKVVSQLKSDMDLCQREIKNLKQKMQEEQKKNSKEDKLEKELKDIHNLITVLMKENSELKAGLAANRKEMEELKEGIDTGGGKSVTENETKELCQKPVLNKVFKEISMEIFVDELLTEVMNELNLS